MNGYSKKILCLVFTLLLLHMSAIAQQTKYKAKIRLKNYTILRGYIEEPWYEGPLRLIISPKTSIMVDSTDIYSVKLKMQSPNGGFYSVRNTKIQTSDYATKTGYFHHAFGALLIGEEHTSGSIGMINGYKWNERFAMGLGVNYDRYEHQSTLPLYIQPRYYVLNKTVSLYSFADLGYAIAWQNNSSEVEGLSNHNVNGGLMGQLGIGYQINMPKSAINFTLGYKIQQTSVEYEFDATPAWVSWRPVTMQTMHVKEDRMLRRVVFTIGFSL
ncbi:MAG: hypothetical protein ACFCUU_01270 [Cyclobacteriaceae bacterium]